MKRTEAMVARGIAALALMLAVVAPAGAALVTIDVDQGGVTNDAYLDGGVETPGTSSYTFTVSQTGLVQDLDVRLAADHGYVEDIAVTLRSPAGTVVELFSQISTGQGAEFQDALFDDETVARRIGSAGSDHSPFTGSYQLQYAANSLGAFDGEQAAGTWTLRVTDYAMGDTGHVYRAGNATPWGSAVGTQLLITVPEPASLAVLALGTLAVRRRRV